MSAPPASTVTGHLKARDRRAFYTRELPREVVEAMRRVAMDARLEDLNAELDEGSRAVKRTD